MADEEEICFSPDSEDDECGWGAASDDDNFGSDFDDDAFDLSI